MTATAKTMRKSVPTVAAVCDRRMNDEQRPAVADRRYSGYVATLGRIIIAAVFAVAGSLKIVDPIGFARSIVDYDLIPELLVPAIAVVLPWWEVSAAGLVIAGRWRSGALAMLLGMSATFLTLGVITFARGLSPECGCFGFLSERVGPASISLQAGLVTISAVLLWREA